MVYSDVIKNNWILPYKEKYTMSDFKKLIKIHDCLTARFIIICSATKYYYENKKVSYSKIFDNILKFEIMDYMQQN